MHKKLKDLAKLVEGEILGNPDTSVSNVSPVDSAKEGDLTFVLEPKALAIAEKSQAAAIVAPLKSKPKKPSILVKNPRLALARILEAFSEKTSFPKGVHKSVISGKGVEVSEEATVMANVILGDNVKIGKGSVIYPGVYVGAETTLGEDCVIHPNAVIYNGIKVGDRVIIHSCAVIGVDGFGFAQDEEGKHVKVPQIGGVIIEDDVEIYANTCVSRGTMSDTIIKRGTKLDNLVHIAHNCILGEDCAIAAQTGFSGGVILGSRVFAGGKAGFSNKVSVGEGSVVMSKAGVTKNFPPNSVISGFPAQEHKKEMEAQALIRRLPGLVKKFIK